MENYSSFYAIGVYLFICAVILISSAALFERPRDAFEFLTLPLAIGFYVLFIILVFVEHASLQEV